MRDLTRLTEEEIYRYRELEALRLHVLFLGLEEAIDMDYDELDREFKYLEQLADGKISRESIKSKNFKPSKKSHKK